MESAGSRIFRMQTVLQPAVRHLKTVEIEVEVTL
jgi:hypothetical protein